MHVEGKGTRIRINLLTLEFMDYKTDFSPGTLDRIMTEVIKRRDELLEEWKKYHEEN